MRVAEDCSTIRSQLVEKLVEKRGREAYRDYAMKSHVNTTRDGTRQSNP